MPSGTTVSASTGAHTSAVAVTIPAGNYYMTEAGGVDSLVDTLETELEANVQPYPQSAAAMSALVGYGTWTAGWLINETSGNLAAAFGAPTLTAAGSPTYSAGPKGGIDRAVGFDSATDLFSGGDVHDTDATSDLVIAWVGKVDSLPAGSRGWFSKGTNPGWYIFRGADGVLNFPLNETALASTSTAIPMGEWHVGMAVFDRTDGTARIAVKGVVSGTVAISTQASIGAIGTMANAVAFVVGDGSVSVDTDLELSALYIGTGAGAAAGMSDNLATAIANFNSAICAVWSVSMSTSTGLVTIANTALPCSLSFTSPAAGTKLGFEAAVDYPQDPEAMATACGGYGTWTAGYLCNEASGDLASVFGTPAALADSGSPTYSNYGPRGSSDKAIGFAAGSDRFSGGDVFDITGTEDLCFAWVGRHSSIAGQRDLFSKIPAGGPGWAVYQDSATTLGVSAYSGGATLATCTALIGEWYVGLAVIDRGSATLRIGVQGLTSGTSNVGTAVAVSATTLTNAGSFLVGDSNGGWTGLGTDTGFKLAALYLGTGSGVATGLSANLSTALSNFASSMKSKTSEGQARGVWFPECPINLDGDPTQAPKESDLRTTMSPTGVVLGLSGNAHYKHTGLIYSHVPRSQVWESAATYANGSWETFFNDTQMGFGHAWFTPASPIQVYWSNAGTDALLAGEFDDDSGVAGWTITGLSNIAPRKSGGAQWTGYFEIALGTVVSSG